MSVFYPAYARIYRKLGMHEELKYVLLYNVYPTLHLFRNNNPKQSQEKR